MNTLSAAVCYFFPVHLQKPVSLAAVVSKHAAAAIMSVLAVVPQSARSLLRTRSATSCQEIHKCVNQLEQLAIDSLLGSAFQQILHDAQYDCASMHVYHVAGLSPAQLDRLRVSEFVQDEGTAPTAFQYLPTGVRGLLQAAITAEDVARHILFNTPVTRVKNEGMVTSTQGSQSYDAVIVTVRPEAAFAMLQPPLQQVYEGGRTGLVDTWIFNASIVTGSPSTANLSDVFLAVTSQNGTLPPRDGTPTFVIKEDPTLPFYAVAAYVNKFITPPQSLARTQSVLLDFGLDVASTTATQRIPFPSQLAQPAFIDNHDHVYLLGEVFAGVGLDVALPYIEAQMDSWFGPLLQT